MAKQLTQFQIARLSRKSSDISRLASQYKNSVNDLSSQFQSSFSEYQKKRDEIMAPYNAATDKYKADFSTYETNLADYKGKLAEYQARLADVQRNPMQELPVEGLMGSGRVGYSFMFQGRRVYANHTSGPNALPDGYTFDEATKRLYQRRDAGKFEDVAPKAPDAPTAPTIEEFDNKPFDEKRAELETSYKREVGERRASRASAVSRKQARPLLQGA